MNNEVSLPSYPIDTSLARTIAIALIFNSHLEAYYPVNWMAGGGLWGITLFFLISGFGITLSQRTYSMSFLPWLGRRIKRIYPSTILATLIIYGMVGGSINFTMKDLISNFVWPTPYSYIAQVMVFYIIGFFLLRIPLPKYTLPIAIISILIPIIMFQVNAFGAVGTKELMSGIHLASLGHYLVNLQTFLIGSWIGRSRPSPSNNKYGLFVFLIIVTVYLGIKISTVTSINGSRLYPILFPLVQLLAVATLFISTHKKATSALSHLPKIKRIVNWISVHTLEIYLVHFYFVGLHAFIGLSAPLGIAFALVCSLISAAVLKKICDVFRMFI